MNMTQISFKSIALALCLISIGATYGQTQTKSFNESFKVVDEAVLDINTSHADIEFETWNKNEILVEATITLEGVSDGEAEDYFKKSAIEIVGNSKKVSISTEDGNGLFFTLAPEGFDNFDFHFESPSIFNLDTLDLDVMVIPDFPEIFEMPPMPPMPQAEFDYKAFKKDGKKYLEEWQKEFSKGFNKDYEKKLEEWSEKMEAKREEMDKKRVIIDKKRVILDEKRNETKARLLAERAEKQALLSRHRNELAKDRESNNLFMIQGDSLHNGPNRFYFSNGMKNRNYKVKKTIKVKLPKSIKIKMNVRHGEVKLAENTKNINATLSYSSLLASTIDGDGTSIRASYSPVRVEKWNYGQLQTNYSEHVDLKEVLNLRLSATSSDVVIEKLLKSAYIKNDFGPLRINSIAKDFINLDISLKNAELECDLPSSAFTVYVKGTSSKFSSPTNLTLERTKNLNSFVQKGYHINKNNDRSLVINSEYSEVILQ